MTHFKILVILPPETSNISEKVRELLSPYYSELEVKPYKEYLNKVELQREIQYLLTLSKEEIEQLAADYEVASDDLESLAKIKLDWYEEDLAGVDENGSYRITTINPQSKWDWYSFIEKEPRESEAPVSYPCQVAELPAIIPYAIVTPDGHWHEVTEEVSIQIIKRKFLHCDASISEQEASWNMKVKTIIACYPNYLAVGLNCHI